MNEIIKNNQLVLSLVLKQLEFLLFFCADLLFCDRGGDLLASGCRVNHPVGVAPHPHLPAASICSPHLALLRVHPVHHAASPVPDVSGSSPLPVSQVPLVRVQDEVQHVRVALPAQLCGSSQQVVSPRYQIYTHVEVPLRIFRPWGYQTISKILKTLTVLKI